MTSKSNVYIAGVGVAPVPLWSSTSNSAIAPLISATTKALLDAGITYDDVSRSVASAKGGAGATRAFHESKIAVEEVGNGSEFTKSFQCISDEGDKCVVMIAAEKSVTIALVLVSDIFLRSHPYLKDSSAAVRISKSEGQEKTGYFDLCRMVWALRGWMPPHGTVEKDGHPLYKWKKSQSFELSRADTKAIPKWKDVEYKQDGKFRLGYNPAAETRDISQEDFEAVCAIGKKKSMAGKGTPFARLGGDRAALARL